MLEITFETSAISKPTQPWRIIVFIFLIPAICAFQRGPTPSSHIDEFLESNIWADSVILQEPCSVNNELCTEPEHHKLHGMDWSQANTNFYADALYPHGSASNELITPHFEEQLAASVVPHNLHDHHKDHNFCGNAPSLITNTISFHHDFNSQFPDVPYFNQNLQNIHPEEGSTHHQTPFSSGNMNTMDNGIHHETQSTYHQNLFCGQKITQSGLLSSGSDINQNTFDHLPSSKDLLSNNHISHRINTIEWEHHLEPNLNDLHPRLPLSSDEGNLLGWYSPNVVIPAWEGLEHTQISGQDQMTRASDYDIEISKRPFSASTNTGSQGGAMGSMATVSDVSNQFSSFEDQPASSNCKKRLLIHENEQAEFTKSISTPAGTMNLKEIKHLKKQACPRKKQCRSSKSKQSQDVLNTPKEIKQPSNDDTLSTGIEEPKHNDAGRPGKRIFKMLKEIGEFHISNVPFLAYHVPIWFKSLREDMMKGAGQKEGIEKVVHKAIECAHWWTTMSFFGLILVHFKPDLNKLALDKLLEHAWKFIQAIFDGWRYIEVTDTKSQKGPKKPEKGCLIEPMALYRYFIHLKHVPAMSTRILDAISVQWNNEINSSKIPVTSIAKLEHEVKSLHNKDMMLVEGGLYSRGSIGNLEFDGINFHSGTRTWLPDSKSLDRRKLGDCREISQSAKFLSPVAIDLCQKVHIFFVNLIKHLLNKYKTSKKPHLSSPEQIRLDHTAVPEHMDHNEPDMDTMVKAISLAEYRVTVGFIGMIRLIYEKTVTDIQMNTLIESGWEFLQKEFSKWKLLEFKKGTALKLDTKTIPRNMHMRSKEFWLDPKRSFQALCIQSRTPTNTPIPIGYIKILLGLWFDEMADPKLNQVTGASSSAKMMSTHSCLSFLEDPEDCHVAV
ncbi:hypothetical protein DFH28DRAFT_973140 [Melampsora americana]|nr:hypothetical protein DFH28DRAFT_973140 [Melampsora americana]